MTVVDESAFAFKELELSVFVTPLLKEINTACNYVHVD